MSLKPLAMDMLRASTPSILRDIVSVMLDGGIADSTSISDVM